MTVGFLASKLQPSDDYVPSNDSFFEKILFGLNLLDRTVEWMSLKSIEAESNYLNWLVPIMSWSTSSSSQEAAIGCVSCARLENIRSDSWAFVISVKSCESICVTTLDLASQASLSFIPSWISRMKLWLILMLVESFKPKRGAKGGVGSVWLDLQVGLLLLLCWFLTLSYYVLWTCTLSLDFAS